MRRFLWVPGDRKLVRYLPFHLPLESIFRVPNCSYVGPSDGSELVLGPCLSSLTHEMVSISMPTTRNKLRTIGGARSCSWALWAARRCPRPPRATRPYPLSKREHGRYRRSQSKPMTWLLPQVPYLVALPRRGTGKALARLWRGRTATLLHHHVHRPPYRDGCRWPT